MNPAICDLGIGMAEGSGRCTGRRKLGEGARRGKLGIYLARLHMAVKIVVTRPYGPPESPLVGR